ncbi:MAG: class I SAM-dependent methyltransferase [Proteobacteria bacterium]|nr:class I SAM-dependent methyltransferase [Pseudomonadota bacterium]MCA0425720.1 class I SAM-dependent methyltransferase [Pseudomonadota bacterium]
MRDRDLKRFAMGLATLVGQEPKGLFSPYRHAGSVPRDVPEYAEIAAMMAASEPAMRTVLSEISRHRSMLSAMQGPAPEPRLDQDWFPRLDAAALYAIIRAAKPGRIVEIGSGHSTRFAARSIADAGLQTELFAIDPQPRAALKGLAVTWVEALLGPDHDRLFDMLEADDILFVDSSHILWPGSDVDRVLARILPRLNTGVLVHIHDIFLPDGYPAEWGWRGYTEQQGVAALLAGGGYDIVFASHYAATRMSLETEAAVAGLPVLAGAVETSLWLRKTRAGVWR